MYVGVCRADCGVVGGMMRREERGEESEEEDLLRERPACRASSWVISRRLVDEGEWEEGRRRGMGVGAGERQRGEREDDGGGEEWRRSKDGSEEIQEKKEKREGKEGRVRG